MEVTNPGALALLVARLTTVVLVLFLVLPITIRELRRVQRDRWLYVLRWVLFILAILYTLPAIFPLWNGYSRIFDEPISQFSTIASYWQAVREVSIGLLLVVMYNIARIIGNKNK